MVEILQSGFAAGLDLAFERKTRVKKESEPPWMTDWMRELIEDRRGVAFSGRGGRQ